MAQWSSAITFISGQLHGHRQLKEVVIMFRVTDLSRGHTLHSVLKLEPEVVCWVRASSNTLVLVNVAQDVKEELLSILNSTGINATTDNRSLSAYLLSHGAKLGVAPAN